MLAHADHNNVGSLKPAAYGEEIAEKTALRVQ